MYTIFESINLLINKPVSQVGQEVTQQLFLARIMSRPDSCNSVLVGLPTSTMQSLQCVWIRNAAAQLAFSLSHFDHVKPTLIQPQWLPVSYEIKLELCCIIHIIHYGCRLAYWTEMVQSVGSSRSRFGLRSSSTSSMDYSLSQLCMKFRERTFSHAGPAT